MSESVAAPAVESAPAPAVSEPNILPDGSVGPAAAATAAPDPKATEAAAKKVAQEIKKWKVKVDGDDVEMDEAELLKNAQVGKAGYKRMQEAASLRKNMEAFVTMLKNDPVRVLSDPNIGVDVKKMAQAIINNELEDLKKSPEQREKEKLQKELEEIKKAHEEEKKTRETAEFQRLQEQASVQIEGDIIAALDTGGVPKSPYTVRKMAEMMMVALQNDIDLSPRDCIPLLKKQMQAEIKEMFGAAPEDMVEELVGKDKLNAIRKKNLAKIKTAATASPEQVKATGKAAKPAEAPKKIPFRELFKGIG